MAEESTHSGIRARYCILDGDKVTFQAWRSKASATLDDAECLEICKGTETIPTEVTARYDDEHWPTNEAEMEQYTLDVRCFRKRSKKAVMLLMQFVSDDIATSLEQFERDPKAMWDYLTEEYDKVSRELRQIAKEKLNSFKIDEKMPVREIKNAFLSLIRECVHQKFPVSTEIK